MVISKKHNEFYDTKAEKKTTNTDKNRSIASEIEQTIAVNKSEIEIKSSDARY